MPTPDAHRALLHCMPRYAWRFGGISSAAVRMGLAGQVVRSVMSSCSLAGVALMTYTGYLGGKMAYEHGVGVGAGHGFDPWRSFGIDPENLGQVARVSAHNAAHAVVHAARETREGEWAPELRRRSEGAGPRALASADASRAVRRRARRDAGGGR